METQLADGDLVAGGAPAPAAIGDALAGIDGEEPGREEPGAIMTLSLGCFEATYRQVKTSRTTGGGGAAATPFQRSGSFYAAELGGHTQRRFPKVRPGVAAV